MLLYQIERFLRETGLTKTKFGRLAARDPRLVNDLRRGREPGAKFAARIHAFMTSYRETAHAN